MITREPPDHVGFGHSCRDIECRSPTQRLVCVDWVLAAAVVIAAGYILGSAGGFSAGRFMGWFAGGVVDVLLGEPLGLNGIIFAGITYLALRFRERFLMYGLIQQAIIVFVVVMLAQLLRTLSLNFFANQDWNWLPLTTALSSAVLWPYSYKLFTALEPRRGFR